jgi:hypothetical protein
MYGSRFLPDACARCNEALTKRLTTGLQSRPEQLRRDPARYLRLPQWYLVVRPLWRADMHGFEKVVVSQLTQFPVIRRLTASNVDELIELEECSQLECQSVPGKVRNGDKVSMFSCSPHRKYVCHKTITILPDRVSVTRASITCMRLCPLTGLAQGAQGLCSNGSIEASSAPEGSKCLVVNTNITILAPKSCIGRFNA